MRSLICALATLTLALLIFVEGAGEAKAALNCGGMRKVCTRTCTETTETTAQDKLCHTECYVAHDICQAINAALSVLGAAGPPPSGPGTPGHATSPARGLLEQTDPALPSHGPGRTGTPAPSASPPAVLR
jgi:hypothetical protein